MACNENSTMITEEIMATSVATILKCHYMDTKDLKVN